MSEIPRQARNDVLLYPGTSAHLLDGPKPGRVPARYGRVFITLAQRHQARCYLLDLEPLDDIAVCDQIWLGTHWVARMPGLPLRRMAVLLDAHHLYDQMAVGSVVASGRALFPFEIQLFGEGRSALRRLTDDLARVPPLLTEWNAAFPLVAVPPPRQAAFNSALACAAQARPMAPTPNGRPPLAGSRPLRGRDGRCPSSGCGAWPNQLRSGTSRRLSACARRPR